MARSGEAPVLDAPSPSAESTTRPRRTSFSFLHRSKSSERLQPSASVKSNGGRPVASKRSSSSGNRLVKKQIQRDVEEVLRQAREEIPEVPPIIPSIVQQPRMQTFGGENVRPQVGDDQARTRSGSIPYPKPSLDMARPAHAVPVPPIPSAPRPSRSESVDPYERTESMTNRGRYSYASSFVSTTGPRRVRRRKDPTPFNILVTGAANSGKTSFIEFLRTSCALPAKKQRASFRPMTTDNEPPRQTSISAAFQSHYLETELSDGERVGLTVWDSEGLETNIVDLQLREIAAFIESKFEETYSEENKLVRSPGVRDTHIHCVFLLLDPLRLDLNMAATRKALLRSNSAANGKPPRLTDVSSIAESKVLDDSLDLQVFRALRDKTAVIPVLSKADTMTAAHMKILKRAVWKSLKVNGLDPLEVIGIDLEEGEDDEESEDDESDTSGVSGYGTPRAISSPRDRSVDGRLDSTRPRGDAVSPARSARTEDSDIIDKAGPGATSSKDPDNEALPPLPLSILTPDPPDIHHNEAEKMPGNVGRAFAWGFADPYNPTHCDFVRLKEIVLGDWRVELREKSLYSWYENWRTARLRGSTWTSGKNGTASIAITTSSNPRAPRLVGSKTSLNAGHTSNPPRGALPGVLAIGGPGNTPSLAQGPNRNVGAAVPPPIRDVSSTLSGRGPQPPFAVNTTAGSSVTATYRGSPSSFGPPRPGGWRSASAQRTGSPAAQSRSRAPTAASGNPEYVTALPPVSSDEVGVAR